ncbi:P-type DNA transfer ATPase VirB11 [Caulobacter henricii]|uniref:Type VI secretion protein n=1 Tax=Caulobacter henricii TaxID=69395 RepID=A0A0P0NXN9_9CAUL|nr:P-type DNA transfer ATPase VirB11 [Caulobacter henricii]ALL12865.1 type VI secretion protein [Caulobacter henricii]
MSEGLFLKAYLAPLAPWFARPDVTDILVNRPGEVWVETTHGALTREEAPDLTEVVLGRLGRQIAAVADQGVSREHPLLSAALPDGSRVQLIAPPATRQGVALAVRRHVIADLGLEALEAGGLFDVTGEAAAEASDDGVLAELLTTGNRPEFLRQAVRRGKTMVISGGTGSGKTTLLNALLKAIDPAERLILIEDAPEVKLDRPNALGLLAVRGEQGEARVDADALLAAALRMRPDRILLGELRGREAFAFLRAVNTGHPGSITTVHADSPEGALDQIALLALTSGVELSWPMARTYVRQLVEVVVQVSRRNGRRAVTDILFRPRSTIDAATGSSGSAA